MEFLDNKAPQEELENIHVLVLVGMKTNKAQLLEVNGYGAIATNSCIFLIIICLQGAFITKLNPPKSCGNTQ